jgi:outer membrane autotransporter protein
VYFGESSNAGSAIINNADGGMTEFNGNSTAGDATLTNNGSAATYFKNNSTAGNAALVNTGAGVFDFSGTTGPNGDGKVSAGSIAGSGIFALGGNALTVGGNNANTTVSGAITDGGVSGGTGGSLVKTGSGTLTLTGANTYTGGTTVEAGKLTVNGSLAAGLVTVLDGAVIGGNGTMGDLLVKSGGMAAPGNSIGTLSISGNLSFEAGSIYQVDIDAAGQSDLITATGTATLAGTVVAVEAAGNYDLDTSYLILHADGGGGAAGAIGSAANVFDGVQKNDLVFLNATLLYDPNNVWLAMTRNSVRFSDIGETPNQRAAGAGAESLGSSHPVWEAVVRRDAATARNAFDQLSGEVHASARGAMLEDSRFVREASIQRLQGAAGGANAAGAWARAFGSWGAWDGDGNAAKLKRSIGGVFFGADAPIAGNARLGAVAGYSRASFDVDDRHSSGSRDDYHLGVYGGAAWGDLAVRSGAAYTRHEISTSRSVAFPGFSDSLHADYSAATTQAFGELGYGIQAGGVNLEPFANLAYVNLRTNGFTERGGAAALASGAASANTTFATLGLHASTNLQLGGADARFKATLGWRHAFGGVTPSSTLAFAGGAPFSIAGVPIARNAAVIDAGLDFALSKNTTFGVSYNGQFGSGVRDQSIRANLGLRF